MIGHRNRSQRVKSLRHHAQSSFEELSLGERIHRSIRDGVSLDIVPLAYAYDDEDAPDQQGVDPDSEVRMSRLDRLEHQITHEMEVRYDELQKKRIIENNNNGNTTQNSQNSTPDSDSIPVQPQ